MSVAVPWSVPGPVSGRQNVPCCMVEALVADGTKDGAEGQLGGANCRITTRLRVVNKDIEAAAV